MWCCGYLLVEVKHFILWWEAFKIFFTSNKEFITAKCIKLKSWWCFPRELSGIHKTRINLGLAVTFNLNVECACICSQLVVGFVLLSYSQITHFGLFWWQSFPLSYMCSRELVFYCAAVLTQPFAAHKYQPWSWYLWAAIYCLCFQNFVPDLIVVGNCLLVSFPQCGCKCCSNSHVAYSCRCTNRWGSYIKSIFVNLMGFAKA